MTGVFCFFLVRVAIGLLASSRAWAGGSCAAPGYQPVLLFTVRTTALGFPVIKQQPHAPAAVSERFVLDRYRTAAVASPRTPFLPGFRSSHAASSAAHSRLLRPWLPSLRPRLAAPMIEPSSRGECVHGCLKRGAAAVAAADDGDSRPVGSPSMINDNGYRAGGGGDNVCTPSSSSPSPSSPPSSGISDRPRGVDFTNVTRTVSQWVSKQPRKPWIQSHPRELVGVNQTISNAQLQRMKAMGALSNNDERHWKNWHILCEVASPTLRHSIRGATSRIVRRRILRATCNTSRRLGATRGRRAGGAHFSNQPSAALPGCTRAYLRDCACA
eukprot:GHVU01118669.1.p1 GENE.GHVU01118669.1~~GHVU01118669.1.p1  ORF type:complete len:328 (+),score=15.16 GHVU01118669.1:780-1763(+)